MNGALTPAVKSWLRVQRELGGEDIVFLDRPPHLPALASAEPPAVERKHTSTARQPMRSPAPVARTARVPAPKPKPALSTPPVSSAAPERPPVLRAPAVPQFDSLADLKTHVEACRRCVLKTRRCCVWTGNTPRSSWFVLTLYGWGEDLSTGRLLSGTYAAAFLDLVKKTGLPDPAVGAVLNCPPADPADMTVQGRIEAARCRPYWTQLLRLSGAKAVLVLDHRAMQLAVGRAVNRQNFRGRSFELEGLPAVATHHPARLARSAALVPDVEADLRQILSAIRGETT